MADEKTLSNLSRAAAQGNYEELPNPLKTDEAAAIARCSVMTIKRACSKGDIRAARFGGVWNINRESLLKYAGLVA